MNKKVCIFPQDDTTEFLTPLYDSIVSLGYRGFHCDSNEHKDEILNAVADADSIIFLGHGTSFALYGTPIDGSFTDIINSNNVSLLSGKYLLLLSCRSSEFCEHYGLKGSLSFGNMPTGQADVRAMAEEDSSFPLLTDSDIEVYNNALVNALRSSLKVADVDKMDDLYRMLLLNANIEITRCLLSKPSEHYREIADLLQDWKNDIVII